MPKVKWGGDLTVDDIEGAEVRQSRVGYQGKLPPAGVYRFKHQSSKRDIAQSGNPKLRTIWKLDGSWKDEHEQFDGYPVFIHMAVSSQTAWRVKQFCNALGVSYNDFMTKMVEDEQQYVSKIGKLTLDDSVEVYLNLRRSKDQDGNPTLEIIGGGYVDLDNVDEDDVDEDDDTDGDDPF